jgi:hypothetical protein
VVFELPPNGIALVRARAAAGDPVFMQLEVRVVDCILIISPAVTGPPFQRYEAARDATRERVTPGWECVKVSVSGVRTAVVFVTHCHGLPSVTTDSTC